MLSDRLAPWVPRDRLAPWDRSSRRAGRSGDGGIRLNVRLSYAFILFREKSQYSLSILFRERGCRSGLRPVKNAEWISVDSIRF